MALYPCEFSWHCAPLLSCNLFRISFPPGGVGRSRDTMGTARCGRLPGGRQRFPKAPKSGKKIFVERVKKVNVEDMIDYKSKLQEEIQSMYRKTVVYNLIKSEGPSHAPKFTVEVIFDGMILGRGEGRTKKEAEQMAAHDALMKRAL